MRLPVVAVGLGFLGSCALNPPCNSACSKLYTDEGGCEIERPGRSREDSFDLCMDECLDAWAESGDVGDYDPFSNAPQDRAPTLDNQDQVTLWGECVAETSCDRISDGYCAPVY